MAKNRKAWDDDTEENDVRNTRGKWNKPRRGGVREMPREETDKPE